MPTYPLKHLLSPNILQPSIQIPNLLHNLRDLALVITFNLAGLSNRHIQREFDTALGRDAAAQPASRRSIRGSEADAMVAGVGGAEDEAAFGGGALRDYTVVVVKGLVDGYVDAHVAADEVGLRAVVVGFRYEVACVGSVSGIWRNEGA